MNHLEKVTLMYLKETFSSHLLHTILLIIEYYPLILFTSTVGYIFSDYSPSSINSNYRTHKTLKFLYLELSNQGFSNNINLCSFIIIGTFSFIYYPLIFLTLNRNICFKKVVLELH